METIVRKYNFIIVAVMLLVVTGVYYFSKDMPREMHGVVGASQWPRFIATVLFIFTLLLLFQTVFGKFDSPSPVNFKGKGLKRVFIIFAALIAFGILLPFLGFLLSSSLFIITVMISMGEKSKLRMIFSSVGISVFIYVFFEYLLNVMLPRPFFM